MTPLLLQHTRKSDKDIISYLPEASRVGEVPSARRGRLKRTKTVLEHRPILMGLPRTLIFRAALSLPNKANSREFRSIHSPSFFYCGFARAEKYMAFSLKKEHILPPDFN